MTAPLQAADPQRSFSSFSEFYRKSVYAQFPQVHRSGGSFGLTVLKVDQSPIDFIDAPIPELVFCRVDTPVRKAMVDSGDGLVTSEKPSGGLVVYPANTASRSYVSDSHSLTQLTLPVGNLTGEMEAVGISASGDLFQSWLSRLRPMPVTASRLMDLMWNVLRAPTAVDHLLLDGLTLQFLAELAGASDLAPLGGARPEDPRIARVVDYIEAHFGEAMDIAELAAIACLSPAHFSRTFKATVGQPVWSYVQQRRCIRAKEMLLTTRLPLVEIAFRCGFSSQAHFTRSIKGQFGVTPGQVRSDGY